MTKIFRSKQSTLDCDAISNDEMHVCLIKLSNSHVSERAYSVGGLLEVASGTYAVKCRLMDYNRPMNCFYQSLDRGA